MKFYCIKNLEKFEISQLLSFKSLRNYDKKLKKNKELLNYHILDYYYQLLLFNSFLLSIQIE